MGAASVVDEMRDARFRWFRHVKRRCVDAVVRRCKRLDIVDTNYKRGEIGRKSIGVWGEVIQQDMATSDFLAHDLSRRVWRSQLG